MGLSGWWVLSARRDRGEGGTHGPVAAKIALILVVTAAIVVLVAVFGPGL